MTPSCVSSLAVGSVRLQQLPCRPPPSIRSAKGGDGYSGAARGPPRAAPSSAKPPGSGLGCGDAEVVDREQVVGRCPAIHQTEVNPRDLDRRGQAEEVGRRRKDLEGA